MLYHPGHESYTSQDKVKFLYQAGQVSATRQATFCPLPGRPHSLPGKPSVCYHESQVPSARETKCPLADKPSTHYQAGQVSTRQVNCPIQAGEVFYQAVQVYSTRQVSCSLPGRPIVLYQANKVSSTRQAKRPQLCRSSVPYQTDQYSTRQAKCPLPSRPSALPRTVSVLYHVGQMSSTKHARCPLPDKPSVLYQVGKVSFTRQA